MVDAKSIFLSLISAVVFRSLDFFNQRNFVIDRNTKSNHSFKLSFIFDNVIINESFQLIKKYLVFLL
ncbi:protein of unknown function [Oenococcus oeni]|nr:hypothetical protein AX764_00350 [Oenococcus oeni]SYV98436.1 hypothetical protein OENI_10040 [Oenococcus oeni]SYW02236.1 hypothetical protein OENI_320011 [Oenococcus oeni]SYW03830.1 hypothetical protein OENI_640002 [Oenococcus oeni]SYW18895.1 hypothetical protein OENI_60040 [Oenococcus oeni]